MNNQRTPRLAGLGLATLLLGSLLPAPAQAQQELYRVEVVIFTQSGIATDNTPEQWPRYPDPAVFERYAVLDGAVEEPDSEHFRLLRGEELVLGGIARRLDNAAGYRVLEHVGWVQPANDRGEAAAVPMPPGSEPPERDTAAGDDNGDAGALPDRLTLTPRPPEGLSGWLRVWRGRYLHVETDLRWLDPEGDSASGDQGAREASLGGVQPVPVMRQERRMRSGELHYLDHPEMGLLIRAAPAGE
ncbi:CsiV family protein [Aquisalimonas lutea]|uniref:CsiV family protein n=1 Tax=Aquisalimonas lutea TaxID=1327750 RepID=UPI0025B4EF39|nr:CsiV family protein [Aquisalimonas lutea]MDN3518449.1 CsiV family protein [Aquisalimonas lutea]